MQKKSQPKEIAEAMSILRRSVAADVKTSDALKRPTAAKHSRRFRRNITRANGQGMKIEDCAVNYRDAKIIVPPENLSGLKAGMSVSGAPIPAGAKVARVGDEWFEVSPLPTMTWFGDLEAI